MCQVIAKKLLERIHRAVPLFHDCRMIIKAPVEEPLQLGTDCRDAGAEPCQAARQPANIVRVVRPACSNMTSRLLDQVRRQMIQEPLDGFADLELRTTAGMSALKFIVNSG